MKKKCIVVKTILEKEEAITYANKNGCGLYYNPNNLQSGYTVVKWVNADA